MRTPGYVQSQEAMPPFRQHSTIETVCMVDFPPELCILSLERLSTRYGLCPLHLQPEYTSRLGVRQRIQLLRQLLRWGLLCHATAP
jgi:hypothetical protein